jgi:hypothetical protein
MVSCEVCLCQEFRRPADSVVQKCSKWKGLSCRGVMAVQLVAVNSPISSVPLYEGGRVS